MTNSVNDRLNSNMLRVIVLDSSSDGAIALDFIGVLCQLFSTCKTDASCSNEEAEDEVRSDDLSVLSCHLIIT